MEVKKEEEGKTVYFCPVCNNEKEETQDTTSEGGCAIQVKNTETNPEYIDESKIKRGGNKVSEICPECDHEGVWVVTRQTRAADEPPTRIYNCPECGTTWREYS